MYYLNCYGRVYRLDHSRYMQVLQKLAAGESFNLADYGQDWTVLCIPGPIIDIGTMTREEAQQRIGGF